MIISNRRAIRSLVHLAMVSVFALAYPAHAGTTLGRLFLTPEERVKLERLRLAPQGTQVAAGQVEAAVAVDPVRLDGYVERSGGHSSAWFNRAVVHDQMREYGLQATGADLPQVGVRLVDGSEVTLRVGQTYDPVSNAIMEVYQRQPAGGADAPSEGGTAQTVDGGAEQ